MKIGINGTGLVRFASVPRIVEDAVRAEEDGFGSYWLAEHPVGGLDALTVLAAVGSGTKDLELGSAIVPTWPRHPMALAAQALTVQQQLSSPLVLGIGLSHRVMLEQLGISMEKPIRHLREFLGILMPLLNEGEVDVILAGAEDEVLEKLEALRAAGVTDFAASEFGRSEEIPRTRELLRRVARG